VIALVAAALPTDVEDLTAVVLAHEYAHAFTHVGADIEGHRWPTDHFAGSESPLKEGLAQYYTAQVCGALQLQFPGVLKAYEALLPQQPDKYRVHAAWLRDYRQEGVRSAMIETRRRGPGKLVDFQNALTSEHRRLGGGGEPPRKKKGPLSWLRPPRTP
jgi:hypothetical protein